MAPGTSITELKKGHEGNAFITDQGIAALLKDLKSRGLLKETLVVWATEFGRTTAWSETGLTRSP